MAASKLLSCLVALLAVASLLPHGSCGCPHALKGDASASVLPSGHPPVTQRLSRKLQQAQSLLGATIAVDDSYMTAMKALIADLQGVIGNCQFSLEGMKYANNDATVLVDSSTVFFPSASWLRAFFHDAGTYVRPADGGPKGGPNGSLGVGCATNTCGNTTSPTPVAPNTVCDNGDLAVGGFSDGLSYCCQTATQCIAHGQSSNAGPTPGLTVPVCLTGSKATVELCRRENDGLLPTIQFFRNRQANPTFQWGNPKQPVALADILVAGAVAVVQQCSGQQLNMTHTFGRRDADVADDGMLPSPSSITEDKHLAVFKRMGMSQVDVVTLVTGSHSIGGFRSMTSPGLTNCPYVPFDCSPSGQLKNQAAAPFDNNVFKVACDGVQGVTRGTCAFNTVCTNPSIDETANGCPFTGPARAAFAACNPNAYPTPGLISDIALCNSPLTRGRMVKYAHDQAFFFQQYASLFPVLSSLGYRASDLTPQNW